MHESLSVSRRNAALLLAGSFCTAAVPAAAASTYGGGAANDAPVAFSKRQICNLLRKARNAGSARARVDAFARCKVALRTHDIAEMTRAMPAGNLALYCQPDPSAMLARVIVRELDAIPATDPAWITRLGDLERIFRTVA